MNCSSSGLGCRRDRLPIGLDQGFVLDSRSNLVGRHFLGLDAATEDNAGRLADR